MPLLLDNVIIILVNNVFHVVLMTLFLCYIHSLVDEYTCLHIFVVRCDVMNCLMRDA